MSSASWAICATSPSGLRGWSTAPTGLC
ncbi:hypothetical protein LEMLEM_LOCUS9593 [Lemmus lemmus]